MLKVEHNVAIFIANVLHPIELCALSQPKV